MEAKGGTGIPEDFLLFFSLCIIEYTHTVLSYRNIAVSTVPHDM